jgi:pre-mRNA cleavage complex 2 protein Pcf11
MSYEQDEHAATVAEDYQEALEGLTMNSRVEINNLTLIARENTESAHAIAEKVQTHIKKVGPDSGVELEGDNQR